MPHGLRHEALWEGSRHGFTCSRAGSELPCDGENARFFSTRPRAPPSLARELRQASRESYRMLKADMTVMLVEDERLLSWSLARSLQKWGFDVHTVANGIDAVREFEKGSYDMILLDYQLPDLDGLAVARSVRRLRPEVVIFLMTAFQLNELAVDSGLIDGYFNKPFDLETLERAVAGVAKKKDSTGNREDLCLRSSPA